jgi:hypothetical protein
VIALVRDLVRAVAQVVTARTVLAATWLAAPPCRCGHPRTVHEHYRAGTDCALCGTTPFLRDAAGRPAFRCPRYRRSWRP